MSQPIADEPVTHLREPHVRIRRIAISATFAPGLAALPVSPAGVAGALVGIAATNVTAPFRALTRTPPYYYGYYRPPYYPYYPPPAPAYLAAPSDTSQPSYTPQAGRSGGNIARQLNQQERNRLQAAPINPPLPLYFPYPSPPRH